MTLSTLLKSVQRFKGLNPSSFITLYPLQVEHHKDLSDFRPLGTLEDWLDVESSDGPVFLGL